MARVAILNSALLVLLRVTVTTSLTIAATSDAVTVRRGEQLQMSCEIDLDEDSETHTSITAVRWERGSNTPLYEMCITSHCVAVMRCNAITADNRGTVQYVVNDMNIGTLTLTLDSSMLEDNATFRCAVLYKDLPNNNKKKSAPISVTVYYLPDLSYPQCNISQYLSGSIPSVLLCSSEITRPVVSLHWTTFVESSKILLSNDTVVVGNEVENTLHLHSLDNSYDNSILTCYLTSVAYPGVIRNCSIGIVSIFFNQTPEVTETSQAMIPNSRTTQLQDTFERTLRTTPTFIESPRPTQNECVHDPPSSSASLVISGTSVGIIIILLVIIAYFVVSKRKLQTILKENQRSLHGQDTRVIRPSNSRSNANEDTQQQAGGISLETVAYNRPQPSTVNPSLTPNQDYETSIHTSSRPLPVDNMNQSSVRPAPYSTNDGYTPYIVSDQRENSTIQTAADTGYAPLTLYEDI